MNVLLDTNVLIDYLGRKAPFFTAAERIIAAGYFGDATLWVPAQSFKDAFYVLERYIDSKRIQNAFLKLCEVVHPVSLSGDDIIRSARLQWTDFEDCLVAVCADKVKADYLITRDAKGFERSPVPVLSPDEWHAMMEQSHGLTYEITSFGES
jgi:predicted nucleic acid-binding protein